MNKRIIIIGSGLSGPLLALLLAQKGYTIDLYEKRLDPRKGSSHTGRSINLSLSHRGIQALKSANVFKDIAPYLIPMKGRMIHCENGELDFQPYSLNSNEYINSVSRDKLNKVLMTATENTGKVNIYFNHTLIEVTSDELKFSSGRTIPNKGIIFGADGVGSKLRKFIDTTTNSPSRAEPLGHAYKELNIKPGNTRKFQIDNNSLHIWPRGTFMLIALPNTDGSFTCTLFMPNEGEVSFASLKNQADVINFFNTHFTDALPLFENFPQSFFDNPTGKLATIYSDKWHTDNLCLIGDAAHAVVPFFGQGMNASFEDCQILLDCLSISNNNWELALPLFNKTRKPDVDSIAKMAIENYIEMRDLVTQPNYILRKKIASTLSEKFPHKFIPRYNMVSFSSIPYSEVYKRGEIQQEIISELMCEKLDLCKAEILINRRLKEIE